MAQSTCDTAAVCPHRWGTRTTMLTEDKTIEKEYYAAQAEEYRQLTERSRRVRKWGFGIWTASSAIFAAWFGFHNASEGEAVDFIICLAVILLSLPIGLLIVSLALKKKTVWVAILATLGSIYLINLIDMARWREPIENISVLIGLFALLTIAGFSAIDRYLSWRNDAVRFYRKRKSAGYLPKTGGRRAD